MTRAIIWDMDGVLADTGPAHYAAWCALMAELGRELTYRQFADTFGMSNLPILHTWLGEDLAERELRDLADRKEAFFRTQVAEQVRLLPGVADWLARARAAGYRQVVASSGAMANIVTVVSAFGIADYFDALLSGSFLPRSKPDPAIFLQAAAVVGAVPARCLVLEDGVVGVQAARAAAMHCIAVTTSHPAERLAGADLIVARLSDLPEDAFARLLG